jgi:hypothetical protein
MNRIKRTTVRVTVAVVASGLAAGIALAVGVAEGTSPPASAPTVVHAKSSLAAQTVPSAIATSYRFMTSGSSTAAPTTLATSLNWPAGYGLNASLTRRAGSVGGQALWMVPGTADSCIELDAGGSACGRNALVEQQGLWIMLRPVSGAAPTLYGIVPDGASISADASSASVARDGNAVMVTAASSAPGRFTLNTASGAGISMLVPAATGQPQ